MATYSTEYEQNLRRVIRDLKALDPLITNIALTERLSTEFNHSFDPRYIKRLSGKVDRALMAETDRTQIEERLTDVRENYRIVRERLSKIVFWQPDPENLTERKPANKDVVEAAKTMVMLDIAVLNAEVANGLYKKPIELLAKQVHYEPLPDEIRVAIIAAWRRGSALPTATIEQMVPLQIHATPDGATA